MRFLLVLLAVWGVSASAWAACSLPNQAGGGVEGEIIYNREWKVMQFCDGTNWIGMGWNGAPQAGGGLLRLSTAEIKALPNPPKGQMVYDTDGDAVVIFDGVDWRLFWHTGTGEYAYACPTTTGWHNKPSGCYYYPTGTADWETARNHCKSAAPFTDLASIPSAAAQSDVTSITGTGVSVFIGLRTTGGAGNWYWVDGTSVDYTNWDPGEPSSSNAGDVAYLRTEKGMRWDDNLPSLIRRYLCKKKVF